MTRVAVGCADYPALQARIANYAAGGEVRFTTRYKPKRADELIGGKLHFIVKHTLVGRVEILRFDDRAPHFGGSTKSGGLRPGLRQKFQKHTKSPK